ncbi:hypothetical protein FDA33_14660 [Clostridium botulinum]|uniref:Uncharacterized protein n=1 Tax=Clostridium botulinum TaxID=1491 RepID=A0A6B4S123_CLOBO|nr:hypothetical protein [Clostridium botulinum]MBY6920197.1 hypothetical protein [Clostridium botulinum]NFH91425.1 hypothetical protein [Clostridium botulinum]NFI19332.1 hypothetical protein [Clostridium botulinum]NFJ58094.1 hypothetical protein [Clostridium botulinum]
MFMDNKKIKLSLNTPRAIRKTLARISNMLINNEIEPKIANTIIYSSNVILSSIRTDELEKKILELEELVGDK